jgi:ferredoxin
MRLEYDNKACSGCRACEMICAFAHFNSSNPHKAALKINESKKERGKYKADICTQCGLCAEACPTGAITKIDNAYVIDADTCIKCYLCKEACPSDAIMVFEEDTVPIKCDLCEECIKKCPTKSLSITGGIK